MRELRCYACKKYLGVIQKGKIKLGTLLICKECLSKDSGTELPDILKNMLGIRQ